MFSIQKKDKKPYWKEFDFYKEHWSIIIFIPALLGGIFQIFNLYSIDPSFVRFFAVEQVIPDGLFVIFIFIIGYLFYLLFKKYYNFNTKLYYGWSFKNILKNISNRLALLTILSICILYVYLLDPLFNEPPPFIFIIVQLVFEILATIYLFEIIFIIIILYTLKNSKDKQKPTKEERKIAINKLFEKQKIDIIIPLLIFPLALILSIFFLHKIGTIYTKVNTLPNTFNEEIFIKKTKLALKINYDLKIQYYNGKYIFLKIIKPNKKENYLILKGESFVNLIDKDEK